VLKNIHKVLWRKRRSCTMWLVTLNTPSGKSQSECTRINQI
jgi:hypothetical protein